MLRKIVSLLTALSFFGVVSSGVWSLFLGHSKTALDIHIVFGILMLFAATLHFKNNLGPFKRYVRSNSSVPLVVGMLFLAFAVYQQWYPVAILSDWNNRKKAARARQPKVNDFELIELGARGKQRLSIELLTGKYYWYPQMAIWIEDPQGNYLETLFVTKATAKGLFYGGRNKENFKQRDRKLSTDRQFRRVNALPVWSHKRNVLYEDGQLVPTHEASLADAISGETPSGNFLIKTSAGYRKEFVLKLEINVAFDDNEYYSEFDFPQDEVFHNGTGQLGQPSLVYSTKIDPNSSTPYYLMEVIGHGHHSAQDGAIYEDLSSITTAKEVVERIVIGIKSE